MSFNFAFVRGNSFSLTLPDHETIATAKRLIHTQYPTVLPETVRLIHRARILGDDLTFSSLGLGATDVIIVQPRSMLPQTLPPFDPNPPEISLPSQTTSAPSAKIAPEIEEMMQMGFGRAACEAALKRARGRVDRAVEYLLNPPAEPQPEPPRRSPDSSGGGGMHGLNFEAITRLRAIAPGLDLEDIVHIVMQAGDPERAEAMLREMVGGGS
jgi:hypothetical protein